MIKMFEIIIIIGILKKKKEKKVKFMKKMLKLLIILLFLSISVKSQHSQSSPEIPNFISFGSTLTPVGKIQGVVSYKNAYSTPLNGVNVTLLNAATGGVISTVSSHLNLGAIPPNIPQLGWYEFDNLPISETYHIYSQSSNMAGGNNSTDALIIELYSIGLYPLLQLYATAADVNKSGYVNSTDALWVKLFTVGLLQGYPGDDWTFDNYQNVYFPPDSTILTRNINGVSYGDVNGSFIPNNFKQSTRLSFIDDENMTVNINEPFIYNIKVSQKSIIGAMTINLSYNNDLFEILSISSKIDELTYTIIDNKINIAWYSLNPLNLDDGDDVISFVIKSKSKLDNYNIFEIISGSEFADSKAIIYDNFYLKSSKITTVEKNDFFIINFPNPFNNYTEIMYNLSEYSKVNLTITNSVGQHITTLVNNNQDFGTYKVRLNSDLINLKPGVYFYRIQVEGLNNSFIKINKMIFTR